MNIFFIRAMNKSQSNDLIDNRKKMNQRTSTDHPFKHVYAPTIDRSLNESDLVATDSRVAARLASNDQLNEYEL